MLELWEGVALILTNEDRTIGIKGIVPESTLCKEYRLPASLSAAKPKASMRLNPTLLLDVLRVFERAHISDVILEILEGKYHGEPRYVLRIRDGNGAEGYVAGMIWPDETELFKEVEGDA